MLLAAGLGSLGCFGEVVPSDFEPPSNANPSPELKAPSRADFKLVGDALIASCGTLDCHGQIGRNLRIYGNHSLRLRTEDNPGGNPTTDAEYDATYWSTIGLEPELLAQVVIAKGAQPERLQLFRKARGDDKHKGGLLMKPGDPIDRCLLGWLAGKTDEDTCTAAVPHNPLAEELAP
ncbi:MAG TPA: hypothetical protein VGG33_22645 [Polyangia bacterium]